MTDNEIVKDLECRVKSKCPECPYFQSYPCDKCKKLDKDTLDLINRLQAENEALYEINKQSEDEISDLRKNFSSRQNLEESFKKSAKQLDKKLARAVELTKAEAYKEFAGFVFSLFPVDKNHTTISRFTISQKLKELVGE